MNIFTKIIFLFLFLEINVLHSLGGNHSDSEVGDGPYLFYLPEGGIRMISVSVDSILTDTTYLIIPTDFTFPVVSHNGKHKFQVSLHEFRRQLWKCDQPDKIMVLSDPHGNMDCFVSVLRGNNVINEKYEWIYGSNHLMIIGDVFDRGKDVLPIFWLIYKLEKEAQNVGGQVSFLLGNHEPMIMAGDYRYVNEMYMNLAERVELEYRCFFGPETELGRWLLSRNTMQIIGSDLFVHAGIGEAFLETGLTIPQVNDEMSAGLFMTKDQRNEKSSLTKLLYGSLGPVWYRGMVRNDEKYEPLHTDILAKILEKYEIKRIIVGHTIFPDIRTFYGGRVINVNVDNKKNFEAVLGRGILIQNETTFIISDKEVLRKLDF